MAQSRDARICAVGCTTTALAAAVVIGSCVEAAAQQSTPDLAQVYSIVKSLQDRVNSLESENRKSQRETAQARAEAERARNEANELRRKLGTAPSTTAPNPSQALASAPPPPLGTAITKAPAVLAPNETVVTAVAAPLPNYYTVGVTPFATLSRGSPTVSAVMPIRVLPTGAPEFDSLTRALHLGDHLYFQPYGTITGTYSHDTSSPYGLPFPTPGFASIVNGPTQFPASHFNARDTIVGATAMWRDPWRGLSATGKVELDFNGDFRGAGGEPFNSSQAAITEVQALGSYSPRVRLAYGRADLPVTPTTDLFLLAGQDWTPFASSTQPHILDTATLGAGFGNIWARAPQVRAGVAQDLGTPWNLRIQAEAAAVQPGWGNLPNPAVLIQSGALAGAVGTVSTDIFASGERQGADADSPEIQGRTVLQFQLDPAEGVPPAQLIASGMYGRRTVDIAASEIPAAFTAAFPTGAQLTGSRYGWTAEAQLPTRFFTVSGKYYAGTGLRFYGGGQLFSEFNDTTGLIGTATAPSIDNSSTLVFGVRNGVQVLADQVEPHATGGFVSVGLPISRWADADPQGYYAGWSAYGTYGRDQVRSEDVPRLGGGREFGEFWAASLEYRPVPNLIFGVEWSWYHTHALPLTATGLCPLFNGVNSCDWSDNRVVSSVTFAY